MGDVLHVILSRGLEDGLAGVALVDRDGRVICKVGEIDDDEAMPIASLVMMRAKEALRDLPSLRERLFTGDVLIDRLEDREVAVGVAGRQLFVVAVLGAARSHAVEVLLENVERVLAHDKPSFVPMHFGGGGGGGGSGGSGPAELQLVELGLTVPYAKA
ncbi:MAG TPA: hypothetical protein VGG74_26540 [Kofleriaceae bacterium]